MHTIYFDYVHLLFLPLTPPILPISPPFGNLCFFFSQGMCSFCLNFRSCTLHPLVTPVPVEAVVMSPHADAADLRSLSLLICALSRLPSDSIILWSENIPPVVSVLQDVLRCVPWVGLCAWGTLMGAP